MAAYILRRLLMMLPVLAIISVLTYIIIELPPGDFLTTHMMRLKLEGMEANEAEIVALRQQFNLDRHPVERYLRWMWGLAQGDMGTSFTYERPVVALIGERLALTVSISVVTILLTWLVAIPVGIYSATHQYALLDYLFTFLGFVGLAVPNFLLALVLMYAYYAGTGMTITGLFSPEYAIASWSMGKFVDMLNHIWIPAIVIGTAGTAGTIRVLRGCLLDELRKQYVITARARGLSEARIVFKYPVRVAINPLLSTVGWILPAIISGETIVAIVLNLPTCGPMLLEALRSQDMHLAGSFIMLLSVLTVLGTLISDVLLAWSDPRIRYE